jgi:hypothetical protein
MADPTDSIPEPPFPDKERPVASRRRLLQGGLSAAPVLMTLVSRPVMAGACVSPSGFVSANASNTGPGVICTGHTPEFWISVAPPPSQWPPGFAPNMPFNAVFNNPPYSGYAGPPPKTLLQVLQLPANPPADDVARLIVAALLNAQAGLTPVLTTQLVKHIWEEYLSTGFGFFSPTAGARWNHDEIIDYLRTTFA